MIDSFDRIKLADAAPRGSEPPETVLTLEALLVDIDERAGYMPIDTRPMEAETPEKNRKPSGWLAAAVAFGVVLLFGGIIALTMMNLDSSSPPADGGETVTTVALTAEQQVRYDTALETIAVFNGGDIDAWMSLFRQDGAFWGLQMSGTHIVEFIEFRMALGEQIAVDECSPYEYDDTKTDCTVSIENDLFAKAGIDLGEGQWIIKSDERGRVLDINRAGLQDRPVGPLMKTMSLWIQEAHPDVWEDVFVTAGDCSLDLGSPNCYNGVWYGTVDTARELVRLADEFIAQSDTYPLDG